MQYMPRSSSKAEFDSLVPLNRIRIASYLAFLSAESERERNADARSQKHCLFYFSNKA